MKAFSKFLAPLRFGLTPGLQELIDDDLLNSVFRTLHDSRLYGNPVGWVVWGRQGMRGHWGGL